MRHTPRVGGIWAQKQRNGADNHSASVAGDIAATPVDVVTAYASDVASGAVIGGKYHIASCVRHLNDLRRSASGSYPFLFDIRQAELFFKFSRNLKHYKGKQFAGKPIELTAVQKFRLGSIFGWRRKSDGLRRFTTSYHELPRKSGKTLEAAVVALYVTFFEGEPGAEGYCIATKRQQAKLVWDACKQLVKSSGLKNRIDMMSANLHRDATQQKLEPLGADADSTDGLNPHFICTDEFHAMKTRELVDVMESATGARLNPHHFQITTAGDDILSPCGDQHDYACKILDGIIEDVSTESFFAFIAHADDGDDWLDERTWQKANPHWGISINPEDMRKLALKAKNMPSAAAEFQQKRLNRWLNADAPWLSIDGWRKGQSQVSREVFIESLKGRTCYAAIDLSSKIDLTALDLLFPPDVEGERWKLLSYCFTPEDTLDERAHRDRAPYRIWKDAGWLITTPGNRIDYDAIRDKVNELDALFDLRQIGFDPWNAGNLQQNLIADGFDAEQIIEIPQTMNHMSAPSKDFEADVLDGLIDGGNNPLLAWCISNAVVQRDGKDNIYPVKKKSRGRIDPVVAAIMARKLAGVETPVQQFQYAEWIS